MRSVKGRWGEVFFIGKDQYVGRSLFNYGEYGPDETETVIRLASQSCMVDDVVVKSCLDIGANFGCIGQALEYHGFNVTAWEPQPEVFACLEKNVKGVKHNCALSSAAGNTTMPKFLSESRVNYGGQSLGTRSDLGSISVEVRTLDSYELMNIGFIKMDVEGFEEEVLRGGAKTIIRCKPVMYIEDDRAERSASLRNYIKSLGYSIEEHNPALYRELNFFGLRRNIWDKNYVSHNLVCRPC